MFKFDVVFKKLNFSDTFFLNVKKSLICVTVFLSRHK